MEETAVQVIVWAGKAIKKKGFIVKGQKAEQT